MPGRDGLHAFRPVPGAASVARPTAIPACAAVRPVNPAVMTRDVAVSPLCLATIPDPPLAPTGACHSVHTKEALHSKGHTGVARAQDASKRPDACCGTPNAWEAMQARLAEMTTCAETRDIVERGLMRYPHVSLGKRLGAGLFGSVHLVKSTLPGFDHPLVVKVAKIPRATNLVHIQQVIVDLSAGVAREAALMTIAGRREGTCPRVAGLWAPVETVGGIVMEMVTGDLKAARDASEYNRPFDVRTPPILAKCAKVLSNLHSVGIIHNDLKCDNFLYKVEEGTAEPTIYIGDLGQATRVNEMAPMRVPGQSRWHPATVLHPSAKALRGTIQARPEHDVYAFLVMVDDLFRRSPKCFVRKATDPVLWELCRKIAFRQQYKHDIVLPDMAGLADMFHKARIFVPDAYPKQ
eukprot:jgi/Mesvir1/10705/Mv13792-RA.1